MNKPPLHKTQMIAIAVFLLLAVFSIGAMVYRRAGTKDAMTAIVSVDGNDLLTIDLSADAEPYEISLEELAGIGMTLEVREHAVRVLHSDCPDQICVHAGWLAKDMDIAICMPNRVSVVVSHTGESRSLRTGS